MTDIVLHIDDHLSEEQRMASTDVESEVRERYAEAARSVEGRDGSASCCTPSEAAALDTASSRDFGTWLYEAGQLAEIPDGAALAALGCGNPTAVADLHTGETVLDLGSGAGIDVLLSARRVGPAGFVYGIDMTDEMLALARKHQAEAGVTNVEFRKGVIEDVPLDDASIDVVISNCVVNLSPDKPSVLAEMFRVLRPGGRIGIADVVAQDELSETERLERGSWVGCIAGALSFEEYRTGLADAGFTDVSIESTHTVADGMHSAIIKATKPTH
jgi:SAM-dependent methyltransferase